ncbi:MAG: hypothetical protein K6A71_08335 [Lachnospiraceae bacterium]|nr:hypothetical protein [Lachnospiraceae bacterium]
MKLKSYLRGLGTGLFVSAVLMGIATSGRVRELSDAEIKQRAAALGMVEEEKVLVKPSTEDVQEPEPAANAGAEEKEAADNKKASDNKEAVKDADGSKEIQPADNKSEENSEEIRDEEKPEVKEEEAIEETPEEEKPEEETVDSDEIRDSKEDLAMGGRNKSSNEKVTGLKNSSEELGYNEYFTIQIASGSTSETVSGLLKRGGAIEDAAEFDDYLCENHYDKKITPGLFKIPVGADYKQIAEIITGN